MSQKDIPLCSVVEDTQAYEEHAEKRSFTSKKFRNMLQKFNVFFIPFNRKYFYFIRICYEYNTNCGFILLKRLVIFLPYFEMKFTDVNIFC